MLALFPSQIVCLVENCVKIKYWNPDLIVSGKTPTTQVPYDSRIDQFFSFIYFWGGIFQSMNYFFLLLNLIKFLNSEKRKIEDNIHVLSSTKAASNQSQSSNFLHSSSFGKLAYLFLISIKALMFLTCRCAGVVERETLSRHEKRFSSSSNSLTIWCCSSFGLSSPSHI